MRIPRLILSIAILSLFCGTAAFAAPVTAPTNVRIVQKDNGPYATIKDALDSIPQTGPSATNPYLIKVMPGTYVEATPVVMRQYVDIVGSGQNNTIITTNAAGIVLTAADHTAVEDLSITTNASNNDYYPLILIGDNVSSVFRNVSVKLPAGLVLWTHAIRYQRDSRFQFVNSRIYSDGTLGHIGDAIGVDGGYPADGAVVEMIGSSIVLSTDQENVACATGFYDGDITIRDSEISLSGNGGAYAVDSGGRAAHVSILGSVIKASTITGGACATCEDNMDIQNSQLIATSTDGMETWGVRVQGTSNITIRNSYITGTSMGIFSYDPATEHFQVGNSQIVNGHNGQTPSGVVNCFDGEFTPIPDLIPQP